MASIDKRKGSWRAQVRRNGQALTKTFRMKADAEAWAREMESAIDKDIDPTACRITTKDTFGSLIDLHIEDLAKFGQPLRRSKDQVLRRLKVELGSETVSNLTHPAYDTDAGSAQGETGRLQGLQDRSRQRPARLRHWQDAPI